MSASASDMLDGVILSGPQFSEPMRVIGSPKTVPNPARFPWHEVRKVEHYRLDVNAIRKPMVLKEDMTEYGEQPT